MGMKGATRRSSRSEISAGGSSPSARNTAAGRVLSNNDSASLRSLTKTASAPRFLKIPFRRVLFFSAAQMTSMVLNMARQSSFLGGAGMVNTAPSTGRPLETLFSLAW